MTVAVARKELITLNPNEITTVDRIEINLHDGAIQVREEGPDWGSAAVEAFMAQLEMGQIPVDSRRPNRIISIPLIIGAQGDFDEARIALQAEVARINEEGGCLKREIVGGKYGEEGNHGFFDLVKADLVLSDGTEVATEGFDPKATLDFEALPDYYGDLVEEEVFEGEGDASETFLVRGNMPARAELTATDLSGHDQLGAAWNARCRNYSTEPTAEWAYNAEDLQPLDLAAPVTLAGSYGAKAIEHPNLSTSWTPVLGMALNDGTPLSHVGLYDLWVRARTTSDDLPWLRAIYGSGDLVKPQENPQAQMYRVGDYYMVRLGQVNLRPPLYGEARWQGAIQARGLMGGENIAIDRVWMRCADESEGILTASLSPDNFYGSYLARDEFNQGGGDLNEQNLGAVRAIAGPKFAGAVEDSAAVGTVAWSNPTRAQGEPGEDYASALLPAPGSGTTTADTHYIKATDFGFDIPVGSTIQGVKFDVRLANSVLFSSVNEKRIRAIKGGSVLSTDLSTGGAWPWLLGGNFYSEFGGPEQLWGTTWSVANINASNFGLAIAAQLTTAVFNFFGFIEQIEAEVRIYGVRATVYYTDPAGEQWMTTGDATDLKVETTGHSAERTAVSDISLKQGRFAIAGSGEYNNVIVAIDAKRTAATIAAGVATRGAALARYLDESNWLMAGFERDASTATVTERLVIVKCTGGEEEEIGHVDIPESIDYRRVWLEVDDQGRVFVWVASPVTGIEELIGVGSDDDLATGGVLEKGKIGFYDAETGASACTRNYKNFAAWVPVTDAVAYRYQDVRISTKGNVRRSADGVAYAAVDFPGADMPRIPVSGPEERPVEISVKPSRGNFADLPDSGKDPFKVLFAYRPCWSDVPDF